jgi:hypothetical protein
VLRVSGFWNVECRLTNVELRDTHGFIIKKDRIPLFFNLQSSIVIYGVLPLHCSASQNLSNVHDLNTRPLPAQHSLNIHQTAHVTTDNRIGTGVNNIIDFVLRHGGGYIRILK